ncbi:MAG TPA: response regulator [Cyclobacteriaceae bacterium]
MKSKLLLIDDREDNLLSIEAILEPNGYHFVKARSGREAFRILLKEFDFSLILMDVRMPNQSGFETATMIYQRDKLKHIPIIFITANNFGDDELFKGYQAGAVDYIYKPVNPDVLRAKVAVFVDLYEKNKKLQQQEKSLIAANRELEKENRERLASEEKVQKLNRQLIRNIDHLETVNKELDRFAFMASHDLQEPLRKIRLFSNKFVIKNRNTPGIVNLEDIERIQRSAEKMQSLIRDILSMARVSADATEFVPTDINVIIMDVLEELDEQIMAGNAKIIVDKIPVLHVHPGLIKLLFRNLINNSLKFTRKGVPPVINIYAEVSVQSQNASDCTIIIKDNGLGFDQKYAEEIFGMFTRLQSEAKFEGTGLGLALCKKIVQHHKGTIRAESKSNEGATFILSFPRPGPKKKATTTIEPDYHLKYKV